MCFPGLYEKPKKSSVLNEQLCEILVSELHVLLGIILKKRMNFIVSSLSSENTNQTKVCNSFKGITLQMPYKYYVNKLNLITCFCGASYTLSL